MMTATRINENLVLYVQDIMEEVALEMDAQEAERKAWYFADAATEKHHLTRAEALDLYRTIMCGGY